MRPKVRMICRLVLTSAFATLCYAATAQKPAIDAAVALARMDVVGVAPWRFDDGSLVSVVGHLSRAKDAPYSIAILQVQSDGWKQVFTHEGDTGFIAQNQIGGEGGPLLTVWGAGSGYSVKLFVRNGGKVTLALDDGSFRMPEVLYPDPRDPSTICIVLAEPAWIESADKKEQVAGEARVIVVRANRAYPPQRVSWERRKEACAK
jgi:hypothetical protein